jgi:type IV secretory pathway VirB10-like protein
MSFTKTISTIAALSSIFGVGVAGFKLAENSSGSRPSALEEKITQLEKKLEEVTKSPPPALAPPPSAPELPPEPTVTEAPPVVYDTPVSQESPPNQP